MKIIPISLIIFIISNMALASYPTVEGLFRNGSNQDITGTYVIVKFLVEESQSELFENQTIKNELNLALVDKKADPGVSQEAVKELELEKNELMAPRYVTWIFSFKSETQLELLQTLYSDSLMKNDDVEYVNYISDYKTKIQTEASSDRGIFNGLISSLVLNDSVGMVSFLKKQGIEFPTNEHQMNQEKKKLLEKYKMYLQAKKEDESIGDEVISPLDSENPQKKKQIEDLLKTNMYERSKYVSLLRENGSFFWQVNINNFKALFTNEKRELYKLEYITENYQIKAVLGHYVLFNGIHHLPKTILLKMSTGKNYKIRMLELKHYSNPKAIDLRKRTNNLRKIVDKRKAKSPETYNEEFYNNLFFIR